MKVRTAYSRLGMKGFKTKWLAKNSPTLSRLSTTSSLNT